MGNGRRGVARLESFEWEDARSPESSHMQTTLGKRMEQASQRERGQVRRGRVGYERRREEGE